MIKLYRKRIYKRKHKFNSISYYDKNIKEFNSTFYSQNQKKGKAKKFFKMDSSSKGLTSEERIRRSKLFYMKQILHEEEEEEKVKLM